MCDPSGTTCASASASRPRPPPRRSRRTCSSPLAPEPQIEVALGLPARAAVPLLEFAGKDLGAPPDLIEVVVGEPPPLLADHPLKLQPPSCEHIPVHVVSWRGVIGAAALEVIRMFRASPARA